jgi:hypothetical protein
MDRETDTQRQTQQGDLIRLLFFQNKESRLKMFKTYCENVDWIKLS